MQNLPELQPPPNLFCYAAGDWAIRVYRLYVVIDAANAAN